MENGFYGKSRNGDRRKVGTPEFNMTTMEKQVNIRAHAYLCIALTK